jgi:hypothetical protein
MHKHYVVCTRSDVKPGNVQIVGPFPTEVAAARWGKLWQVRHNDNPCWQTVTLPDGFVPSIAAPSEPDTIKAA